MHKIQNLLHWLQRGGMTPETPRTGCGLPCCPRSKSPRAWWRRTDGAVLQDVYYCGRSCLETALSAQLARLHAIAPAGPPPNRIPLGLLMVARGWLTHEQVARALAAQEAAHKGQIGDWFEKLGFATEREVTSALALQWGCPVATSLDSPYTSAFDPIPLGILEAFQMLPIHFNSATNTIYIAFGQRVDHAALYAIEKFLGCRTLPCVAGRKHVTEELIRMRQQTRPSEIEFAPMSDFAEIGRVSVSYMVRLGADQARLGRVGDIIWLRLRTSKTHTDVLFQLKSAVASSKPALALRLPKARVQRSASM
jgi:hypothetical protein